MKADRKKLINGELLKKETRNAHADMKTLKGGKHLEHLGTDERIILTLVLT
jgi:hypothetical protein